MSHSNLALAYAMNHQFPHAYAALKQAQVLGYKKGNTIIKKIQKIEKDYNIAHGIDPANSAQNKEVVIPIKYYITPPKSENTK